MMNGRRARASWPSGSPWFRHSCESATNKANRVIDKLLQQNDLYSFFDRGEPANKPNRVVRKERRARRSRLDRRAWWGEIRDQTNPISRPKSNPGLK